MAPASQRSGLGRTLIRDTEAQAQASALPRLRLETRIELTGNHAAFARLGFVPVAQNAHPGFDRPTSVTMEKPVAQPMEATTITMRIE